jgi:Lar family restriction alleviation protein
MTKDLKPCPFCGGEADVVEDEVNNLVWCVCSTCGATGGVEGNNQDAIEVWNRRTDNGH